MSRTLTRLGPQVWGPTGKVPVGRAKFYRDYISTGRVKTIPLGRRATAVVAEQIDEVVEEIIEAGLKAPPRPPLAANLKRKQKAA